MRTTPLLACSSSLLGLIALGGCATNHSEKGAVPAAPPPAQVGLILDSVRVDRMEADLEALVGFGTRHTLSETDSETRGIGAARRYIRDQFQAIADTSPRQGEDAIQVYMDSHEVPEDGRRIFRDVEIINPMLMIPGSMPEAKDRLYYVIAHYDSRASDPNDATSDAPGANDDASGVVLTMELARIFAEFEFDATVIFMPVAGEEQGLYGAREHAKKARANGLDIRGVLSNDMVGDPTDPLGPVHSKRVRVFSEGIPNGTSAEEAVVLRRMGAEYDSPSRQLARYIAMTARWHDLHVQPWLIARPDRFLRGGDHTGFNEAGYAAVRFCDVAEDYDRQHQDVRIENGRRFGDDIEFIDYAYLADVTKVNGAALAHLANAPSKPANTRIIAVVLANDTTLRWDVCPEPDVAGYEILIRDTTAPDWRVLEDVGNVTEATVAYSKDNWFFGVRAYDHEGYRSPVAYPRAARE